MIGTTSEEVDDRQLELARSAGDAYREALEYMTEAVAHTGSKKEGGDYLVGFAQDGAGGLCAANDDGEPYGDSVDVSFEEVPIETGRS
jgi:hypothetical protein